MRLFVLGFLLLGAAPPTREPSVAPRPLVVLVHGRGQLGTDSAALRREWKGDLDAALASQGMPALRDEDVRLAWYADVMDPAVHGACAADGGSSSQAGFGDVARGFLVSLVALMPDSGASTDREARSLIGDMLYLVDPATRCAAETRLGNVLAAGRAQGRPIVVVAYSLGAAVAFDYLNRAPARDSLSGVHLITLGSPLGVPIAREILLGGASLQMPRGASRWVNIYDPDDAFAAPVELRAQAVEDRRVKSTSVADPHWARRYFRDDETGRALAEALCASDPALASGCGALRAQ